MVGGACGALAWAALPLGAEETGAAKSARSPGPVPALPRLPAERMGFWQHRPLGFATGTFGRTPFDSDYYHALAATGARVTRTFLRFDWDASQSRYVIPPQSLAALGEGITHARALGFTIVLVGDFEGRPNPPLWGDAARARGFAEAWRRVARMLRDVPVVVGFDLLNEPIPHHPPGNPVAQRMEWVRIVEQTIEAVRVEDANMPIVVEGVTGGMPVGLRDFPVLADRQVVYSIHFYSPHAITHQHVSKEWTRSVPYPVADNAVLQGTDAYPGPWNVARLRRELQDAVDFQRRSGAPMYVGEFSCVRWAPGDSAFRYVNDCVGLFREFGWSWTYHEYRGWPGWDAEIASTDPRERRRSIDAPVMSVLRRELAQHSLAPPRVR